MMKRQSVLGAPVSSPRSSYAENQGLLNIGPLLLTALLLTLAGRSEAGVNKWTISLPTFHAGWHQSLAIDSSNPVIAYVAMPAGVFKTTDLGGRWTLIDPVADASAVAIDPRNPSIIITGYFNRKTVPRGSIRRSEDGGATWQDVSPPNEYERIVRALVFEPSEPGTVYAASETSGVRKSVDGGKTWTISNNGLPCCVAGGYGTTDIAIGGGASGAIYVAARGRGLFSSTDRAESWQPVGLPVLDGQPIDVRTVSVDPTDPARLFVTSCFCADREAAALTSGDAGKTWERLPLPRTNIGRIEVDPRDPTTLYAPTEDYGVLRSTDRGTTWTGFNDGLEGLGAWSITIDPTGSLLYATTEGGVYVYEQRDPARSFERLPEDAERLPHLLGQVVALGSSTGLASVANAFILPVAGAVRGGGGQMFLTEVSLANSRADEQDVVLAWLPQGNTRGPAVPMFRGTLPAASEQGEGMLVISNLPGRLGLTGLGSIVVVATDGEGNADPGAEIYGFARVWSPAGCGSGTTSQSLPAVAGEAFGLASRARALGLRHDGAYRTNVGIVNLDEVAREFTVLATGERHAERFTIWVHAYSLSHTAVPDRAYGSLAMTVTAGRGAGPWTAYGSSVDNASGDAWAAVAMPLLTN